MSRRDQQQLLTGQSVPQIIRNGHDSEKSPFLTERNKPVSLTPAWEANNLPNDELNMKGMTMDRAKMELSPPHDKWKLVFFTFLLHGLGTLIPWNMFITAKDYFVDFKLDTNSTGIDAGYATNFLTYVGFASQIPNVVFNWMNIFVRIGGDLTTRIVWSILIEIVLFIFTVVLAMTDSSAWPEAFFWITIISLIIISMANGIYQNTVFGIVATLPIKYTGAVVLGSNISGLFATIISITSSSVFDSPRTAAIYYFITAIFILILCFDTYFALPLNRFFRYNEMMHEKETNVNAVAQETETPPYWEILKQAGPQLFNIFLTFFVTLAVFPAVHSDIRQSDKNFIIPEKLFTAITCFLTFNLFAMLGSLVTSWVKWPKPKFLVIPVVLRILFIPLFLFCNYLPRNITRVLPVFITNDWGYWVIAIIMSFSSGYLSSLGMMYAPQTVNPKYAVTAGMFAAAFLITGIFSGICFSRIFPEIVSIISF